MAGTHRVVAVTQDEDLTLVLEELLGPRLLTLAPDDGRPPGARRGHTVVALTDPEQVVRHNGDVLLLEGAFAVRPLVPAVYRHVQHLLLLPRSGDAPRVLAATGRAVRRGRLQPPVRRGLLVAGTERELWSFAVVRTVARPGRWWLSPHLGVDGLGWSLRAAGIAHTIVPASPTCDAVELRLAAVDLPAAAALLDHRPGTVPVRVSTTGAE